VLADAGSTPAISTKFIVIKQPLIISGFFIATFLPHSPLFAPHSYKYKKGTY